MEISGRYKIGFIIEQALGHITHGQNLQQNIARDSEIEAYWGLPARPTNALARRIPVYKTNWTLQVGWQTRQSLAGFRRQARLDALFFHTQVAAVLAQDWMRRIPSVVSLDATPEQYDSLGQTYAHQRGPEWLESQKVRLNRDCFRAAKQLVTWSAWAKQGLVDRYEVPPEKIEVIPPGVNIREWTPPTRAVEQSAGLPASELVVRILFVGGDFKRKGGQILLEAFHSLRQEIAQSAKCADRSIELHLVTRDPIPVEPGLFVYNHMQPNSPELKALFFKSHIFCLPTYGDCLPMVLAEAGAAGLPLVSTRVGAIPEIVRDGETGLLIPIGDPTALAVALHRLVCDPVLRVRMGACAAEVAARNHDAEYNAAHLLGLLKQTARETVSSE